MEAVNAWILRVDIMTVGEAKGAGRIFVIDGKDAAPSLLASSPHNDNIRKKLWGKKALSSSQCSSENKCHSTILQRLENGAGGSRFGVVSMLVFRDSTGYQSATREVH